MKNSELRDLAADHAARYYAAAYAAADAADRREAAGLRVAADAWNRLEQATQAVCTAARAVGVDMD